MKFPIPIIRLGAMPALLAAACAHASTFEERAEFVLENLRSTPVPSPGGTGKLPYGRVIAALAENPADTAALNYLANTGYGGEIFFNSIMQVRALYMAGDNLSAAQKASILEQASSSSNNWNNRGTENHRKMTWSSGYLLAQYFPDAQWNYGSESIDSAELMRRLKANLAEVGRNEYRAGYSEFLSPNYEIYHVAPMVNLYDFAEDPEVRALADASLLHHFSLMALGSFEEIVMPPWSRYAGDQDLNLTGAYTQLLLWLFWGHGNFATGREIDPTSPLVYFALSDWRPPAILDDISHRVVDYPYTARMQQTHFGWTTERYVMRTTYQNRLYAVSSGVVRHLPAAFQLDDSQFMIAWDGGAEVRQITAYHPYWRSESMGEDDWLRPTSPFMQTGHHENAAIMLFDIPAEDPWAGVGQWAAERAGPMIPLAQMRFPSHMIYSTGDNGWVFLSDGPVYVAVNVLRDGWTRDRRTFPGFNVLKSRGTDGERWRTGFVYEVATSDEFASIEDFKAAVAANQPVVDWHEMTASYTTTRGAVMEFRYNTSMEGIPNHTVPEFSVSGRAVAYDASWPSLDSPWATVVDHVLVLTEDNGEFLVADWSGKLPVVETVVEYNPGREEWAGYTPHDSGFIDTGDFMGWVYPVDDHVFLLDLGRYVLMPESLVTEGGAWMYLHKDAE